MPYIKIDKNRCKGCLLCIEECPKKCIKISVELNNAGYTPVEFTADSGCTACGLCYQICPDCCIEVVRDKD